MQRHFNKVCFSCVFCVLLLTTSHIILENTDTHANITYRTGLLKQKQQNYITGLRGSLHFTLTNNFKCGAISFGKRQCTLPVFKPTPGLERFLKAFPKS